MGDFESAVVFFRKPDMTAETHRPRHKGTNSACTQCGAHLQTYCDACGSLYVEHDTTYDCGYCGTPKNMYCGRCGAPQSLEHFYYRPEERAELK